MKLLLFCALTLVPLFSHAETEFVFGAASYHLLGIREGDTRPFRAQWSKDGRLIGTPLVAVARTHHNEEAGDYYTLGYFAGLNSVGGNMGGVLGASGADFGRMFRMGVVAGLYLQNASQFYSHGLSPGGLPLGQSLSLVGLAGFEFVYGSAVKWHLVLTPALALTYLGFSF